MSIRLTEQAIGAALKRAAEQNTRIELADAGHRGLRLRVTPAGKKTWTLGMRDGLGQIRRFNLGTHPTIGIAEARDAARRRWVEVKAGADPIAEDRKRRALGRDARENVGTLAALIDLYERKEGSRLKTWSECRRRIESVFGKLLKKPMATMKLGDLQFEADNWASAASASAAVRYLRPILKWGAAGGRGYVDRNLANLVTPAAVGRRERVLAKEELLRLLPALKSSHSDYAAAMRLMLLTGCRREEAGAACWRDVDFTDKTWTIPETKNGKPNIVPLSHQAIALLMNCRPQDGHGNSVTPKPDDLIFQARGGGRLSNWHKAGQLLMKASKTSEWTRHDLRRTAATLMGELGEPPHVIESTLNHASVHSELASLYNKSRYRPEVAVALQRLADALDAIAAGGATVTPLRPGAAA